MRNNYIFPYNFRLYKQYPFYDCKKFIYDKNKTNSSIIKEGKYYQEVIIKILEKNIFNGFNFYKEESGTMKTNFEEYNSKIKIKADFFVKKIQKEKFKEILEERKYMMKTYFRIDENIKNVNIIGKIKLSQGQLLKKMKEKQSYLDFIKEKDTNDEKFLLMYVYNQSFYLFKEDINHLYSEDPIIYCYIPKLYRSNCYEIYNKILKKYDKIPNQINAKKQVIKRTKREIEKENNRLKKMLESSERINNMLLLILISTIIVIISQLLAK